MDRKDFLRTGLASLGAAVVPHVTEKPAETVSIPAYVDGQIVKVYAPEDGAIFHLKTEHPCSPQQLVVARLKLEEIKQRFLKESGKTIHFIITTGAVDIVPLVIGEEQCTCGLNEACSSPNCEGYYEKE